MSNLLHLSPGDFIDFLKKEEIQRFHFVYDESARKLISSHSALQPIAEQILANKRDFDAHEGLFFQVTHEYPTLQGAFVHRTNRGQAAGGTRFWPYATVGSFLEDGLRLARGMTYKNALAGLWWGGGKGIIVRNPQHDHFDPAVRQSLFREYGEFMSALRGCYVTAEDVGTNTDDIDQIFKKTRFTTCISPALGGSGNPSVPTALGVVRGMEAALHFLGEGTLAGKTIAVQGVGNVGQPLIQYLFESGVGKVIATDISERNVESCKKRFAGKSLEARTVAKDDHSILNTACDILAPCATGAILNPTTIPGIRAKVICGAANNQLEDGERDDRALFDHGIIYVPDFLVNRMGIVNCANEQYGYIANDPLKNQHLNKDWDKSIYQMTMHVLSLAKEKGLTPGASAQKVAAELSRENHPILGHRGQQIIDSLVADHWYEQ